MTAASPHQIRPARIAAAFIQPGDVIVTAPGDEPEVTVVGTVATPAQIIRGVAHFTVRAPSGSTWVMREAAERPVWIDVPRASAATH